MRIIYYFLGLKVNAVKMKKLIKQIKEPEMLPKKYDKDFVSTVDTDKELVEPAPLATKSFLKKFIAQRSLYSGRQCFQIIPSNNVCSLCHKNNGRLE